MAEINLNTRYVLKSDTKVNWESINPSLLPNEIVFDTTENDFKINSGSTLSAPFSNLPYLIGSKLANYLKFENNINGIVKANGGVAQVATKGTDYPDPAVYQENSLIPTTNRSFVIGNYNYQLSNIYTNTLQTSRIEANSAAIRVNGGIYPGSPDGTNLGTGGDRWKGLFLSANDNTASNFAGLNFGLSESGSESFLSISYFPDDSTLRIRSTSNSQTSAGKILFSLNNNYEDPIYMRSYTLDTTGLYPETTHTCNLGSSSKSWYLLYADLVYTSGIYGLGSSNINVNNSIVPFRAKVVNLGASTSPFQNVYTTNLYATAISSSDSLDLITDRYIYLYKDQVTTGLVIDTTELEIGATNAANWSIGNLSLPFGDVFTSRLTCPLIESAWNNQLAIQGDIVPSNNMSYSIGTNENRYHSFYGNSIRFPEWTSSAQTSNGIYFGDHKILYQPENANRLWLGDAKFDRSYLTTGTGWWITVYDLRDNSSHQVNVTTNSFGSTSDNDYYLGYSNHRWKAVYAVEGAIQTSDRSLKSDIHYIDSPKIATRSINSLESSENSNFTTDDLISFIKKLNPAVFRYGKEGSTINEALQTNDTEAVQLGLIADDIKDERLFNYIGATMHYEDEETKEDKVTLGVKAIPLAVLALSACKYLINKVEELENK